ECAGATRNGRLRGLAGSLWASSPGELALQPEQRHPLKLRIVLNGGVRAAWCDHQLAWLPGVLVEVGGLVARDLGVPLGVEEDQGTAGDALDRGLQVLPR